MDKYNRTSKVFDDIKEHPLRPWILVPLLERFKMISELDYIQYNSCMETQGGRDVIITLFNAVLILIYNIWFKYAV